MLLILVSFEVGLVSFPRRYARKYQVDASLLLILQEISLLFCYAQVYIYALKR
jgi:hypothetical protein